MTTFRNAKDIPKGFVQRRVHLRGRVEKVEDGVIEVSHLPILPLPWKIQSSQRGKTKVQVFGCISCRTISYHRKT